MKKLIYFFILACMLTSIIACDKIPLTNIQENLDLTQRDDNDYCVDTSDCVKAQVADTQFIYVAGYSPCEIYAIYDLWECKTLSGVVYKYAITNFKVELISNGCDSLLDRWDSLRVVNDFGTLTYEMDVFYAAAKSSLENYLVGQFFANPTNRLRHPCGGGPSQLFISEFYSALCYIWCTYEYGNPPLTSLNQLVCGDACCKKEVNWCWNGTGVTKGTPSYTDYGSCADNTIEPCYGGTTTGNCDDHDCEP